MSGPIVWWEDANGNGIPDGRFTDQNGDGYLGVGDSVLWTEDAFIYEQSVNEYTASVFESGIQSWAGQMGWGAAITAGGALSHIDMPGIGGIAILVVSAAYDFIYQTFGNIDFGTSARIATEYYADEFGTYNPYEDDDYVPIIGGWHPEEPEAPAGNLVANPLELVGTVPGSGLELV